MKLIDIKYEKVIFYYKKPQIENVAPKSQKMALLQIKRL